MSRPEQPSDPHRPRNLFIIVVILVLESLALLAAATWYVVGLLTSTPLSYGGAIFTLVLLVALAIWLLVVASKLFAGFRWSRSGALVVQLFAILIAVPLVSPETPFPGLLLVIFPAAVIVLLFTRPVVAYTTRTQDSPRTL